MVDEKKCYLFGRNQQLNDFCIDHASCSRVHAALVYHKHLNRAFLVDLGSTHGTFIGSMRLEAQKPTQLPIDSTFHFGASTRYYIIRERPQTGARTIMEELEKSSDDIDAGGLLGLPETETELDNLTEFNTAHNRRISMLGITDDDVHKSNRKRKKKGITFNDDEEVINPEDVDPSVGRFRNLVQTTVVPSKRMRLEGGLISLSDDTNHHLKHLQPTLTSNHLYHDLPPEQFTSSSMISNNPFSAAITSVTSRLGIALPNPAPDVEMAPNQMQTDVPPIPEIPVPTESHSLEPKKKKYAKEAWPGKKPLPTLLV
ncbi:nuclear inhibitor of protein phosphatase 1 isoform X2 [Chelonus insularis]|nr:nuclear inhibitor of protein phosphatase 1 isoform X2 [Chelonus insularis]